MGQINYKLAINLPQYLESISKRPLSKSALICTISASGSNFNPRSASGGPVVKIFAFLDLEQISGDFDIEHFETTSL